MQTATPSSVQSTLDLAAVKQRQQATWACGDYAVVGTTLQIVGEQLAETVDAVSYTHLTLPTILLV